MKTFVRIGVVTAVLFVAGVLFAWSGTYDVAADVPHWRLTEAVMQAVRTQSVAVQSGNIEVPADLGSQKRIAAGASEYAEMCTGCHLAPGESSTELRDGLYPQPPDLGKRTTRDPRAAFWIIKHGIKMTAMPAWGRSHDDQTIWDMVAFVQKLPDITPQQYRKMTANADPDAHEHHHMDAMSHTHE